MELSNVFRVAGTLKLQRAPWSLKSGNHIISCHIMSHVTHFFGGAHLVLQSCGSGLICIWIILHPTIPPSHHPTTQLHISCTFVDTRNLTTTSFDQLHWLALRPLLHPPMENFHETLVRFLPTSFQDIPRSLFLVGLGQLAQVRIEVGQLAMCGLVLEISLLQGKKSVVHSRISNQHQSFQSQH